MNENNENKNPAYVPGSNLIQSNLVDHPTDTTNYKAPGLVKRISKLTPEPTPELTPEPQAELAELIEIRSPRIQLDFDKIATIVKKRDFNALQNEIYELNRKQAILDAPLETEQDKIETTRLLSRIKECPNPYQKECLNYAQEQQALRIKNKHQTQIHEALGAKSDQNKMTIARQYFDINQKEIEKQLEDVVALYSVKDKKPFYFISQPEARLAIEFIKDHRKTQNQKLRYKIIEDSIQQLRYNIVEDSIKLLPQYVKDAPTLDSPLNITKDRIYDKDTLANYSLNPHNKFIKTPQDLASKPITEEKFACLYDDLSLFKYQNTVIFEPTGLQFKPKKTQNKNKNNENVSQTLSDADLNNMFAIVEEKDLFVTHIVTHAKILAQLRNLRYCFNDTTYHERSKFPLLMGYALEREVLIFNHIPENAIFLVAFKQNMNLPDNVNEYNDESEVASLTPHFFLFLLK